MSERPDYYDRHPWFKKYSREWLEGSIRFDCTPDERSVFDDFLSLANESRNRGIIQANDETPYPHSWLAAKLNVPLELLERCILKFTEQQRVIENEHGILVVNFSYWQGLDTRRRGRPTKQSRQRPEPTEEEKLESEYNNRVGVAAFEKRQELGRSLSTEEITEITDKIKREVYGNESTTR